MFHFGTSQQLFRSRFPWTMHQVRVALIGARSNRLGIGARVVAHCGGRQMVRDVFPASGCMGAGPAEMLLGVGEAQQIDRLSIRWPSGAMQELQNVPVNRRITVVEGQAEIQTAELSAPPRHP